MERLIVSIEHNGEMIPAGFISGNSSADSCFCYSMEYLHREGSTPVSVSLPLQETPFSAAQTRTFFEGLLPEGFTRRMVAQWMHAAEDDYLAILHGLGRECLGALCITLDDETTDASYERISKKQVRELAAEGADRSAELVTRSHLSLTGASGKAGLYYDSNADEWYLPRGNAPSTHIVKQSHVRLEAIVTNEQLSLLTASKCGIHVPESFIIKTGRSTEDGEVLFATPRYDRIFPQNPVLINSLPRPLRLHQEDFAQAMGIPSTEKYEPAPRGYLRSMFELLRRSSANPVADQLQLWDNLIFNYLIGNTDAHLKNYSLLYGSNMRTIRLAPSYDIISTTVYEQSTKEMALYIGDALSIDDISRDSFRIAAKEIGLGDRIAMNHFDDMCKRFCPALHEAAAGLSATGFSNAAQIEARILESGGIRHHL